MTRDEKIDFLRGVHRIEVMVSQMNGPYRETTRILEELKSLRDGHVDDDIYCSCEGCDEAMLESEIHCRSASEDGWYCDQCMSGWGDDSPTPHNGPGKCETGEMR